MTTIKVSYERLIKTLLIVMYITDGADFLYEVGVNDQVDGRSLMIMYLLSNDLLNIVCRQSNLIEAHYVNYV